MAIHEAGHALVTILLCRKVTGKILRPHTVLSGETQFANDPDINLDLNTEADCEGATNRGRREFLKSAQIRAATQGDADRGPLWETIGCLAGTRCRTNSPMLSAALRIWLV